MFIINDMELLSRVGKYNILSNILLHNSIAISALKLHEYSFMLKKQIQTYTDLNTEHPDDGFDVWMTGKRSNASIGDLSSIYIAQSQDLSIVLSDEDKHLSFLANAAKVVSVDFDEFILQTVKDKHMIQIYNLIKKVA